MERHPKEYRNLAGLAVVGFVVLAATLALVSGGVKAQARDVDSISTRPEGTPFQVSFTRLELLGNSCVDLFFEGVGLEGKNLVIERVDLEKNEELQDGLRAELSTWVGENRVAHVIPVFRRGVSGSLAWLGGVTEGLGLYHRPPPSDPSAELAPVLPVGRMCTLNGSIRINLGGRIRLAISGRIVP